MQWDLGRVMQDRGQVQSAYQGGCPPKLSQVKSQVKFQIAWIELELGEGNARPRTSAKCISMRMPLRSSEVKGQFKFKDTKCNGIWGG